MMTWLFWANFWLAAWSLPVIAATPPAPPRPLTPPTDLAAWRRSHPGRGRAA